MNTALKPKWMSEKRWRRYLDITIQSDTMDKAYSALSKNMEAMERQKIGYVGILEEICNKDIDDEKITENIKTFKDSTMKDAMQNNPFSLFKNDMDMDDGPCHCGNCEN
jgi:hypothetical protein